LISITSPIGRSLVGKMEGDFIEIVTPSGKKDFEMRSLRTIHEMED
jgi:transcription elongation factor GreA